jgi:hypothetical protein
LDLKFIRHHFKLKGRSHVTFPLKKPVFDAVGSGRWQFQAFGS